MTAPIFLLAPAAGMTFTGAPSGATYVSNQYGLVLITNNSAPDEAALIAAGCVALYPTTQSPVAVSALPSSSIAGQRQFVSDSTVAASGNFGAIVAGGGANTVPVYSDGAHWRIG